jgi:hypothetical protein
MADVRDSVEFGLATIDPNRRIEISARDAMRVYSLLGELVAFFHTNRTAADTRRFVGTRDSGALGALFDAYYGYLRDVWPEDIGRALEDGTFDAGAAHDQGHTTESFSISDGEVSAWIEGGIHLKAVTSNGDPVELSESEARAVADALDELTIQLEA